MNVHISFVVFFYILLLLLLGYYYSHLRARKLVCHVNLFALHVIRHYIVISASLYFSTEIRGILWFEKCIK